MNIKNLTISLLIALVITYLISYAVGNDSFWFKYPIMIFIILIYFIPETAFPSAMATTIITPYLALVMHLFTIYVGFTVSTISGIVTIVTPGFSQIYWLINKNALPDTLSAIYAYAFILVFLVSIQQYVVMFQSKKWINSRME